MGICFRKWLLRGDSEAETDIPPERRGDRAANLRSDEAVLRLPHGLAESRTNQACMDATGGQRYLPVCRTPQFDWHKSRLQYHNFIGRVIGANGRFPPATAAGLPREIVCDIAVNANIDNIPVGTDIRFLTGTAHNAVFLRTLHIVRNWICCFIRVRRIACCESKTQRQHQDQ